ncbi:MULTISPECIES: hypothetical protein [unclassified Knoellia]|uniref:hypothetical protein n=1 Tax=Knoellia altitudinis TaxID=3404795 RepID=UPI003607AB6F
MTNLLATIVATRHLAPEPVATDALVHLCSTSTGAASAMADLLVELCPGTSASELMFTGQEITAETEGRPDLVASDPGGTRMVLEAKFDAELTPAQMSGAYVNKLAKETVGALVFLVPQDRMRNVWTVISVALGGGEERAIWSDASRDAGIASMPLGATAHTLAVMSWESLLTRIEAAVVKHGDAPGQAELGQLRGLVQWRSRAGWVPLAPDDLPQRVGRQLDALTETVRSASARASSAKIRNGTADGGFGRHISTPSGKSIWVGIWMKWWDLYGPGPVWAQIALKTTQELALTSQALAAAGIAHHTRASSVDALIPLAVPLGAEQGTAEEDIFTQIRSVIDAIDILTVDVIEDDAQDLDSDLNQP